MNRKKNLFSRQDMNKIMAKVPAPLLEHMKRCRKLAKFFVERLTLEDWFLDLHLNSADLVSACSYHDIGKMLLPLDNYYLKHCNTIEKKDTYREHVELGIQVLTKELKLTRDELEASSGFPKKVYNAILEHHERMDGRGFPKQKKDEEISFEGRFTALIDTFDNLLFVGQDKNIDLESAVTELKSLSGVALDDRLVNAFLKDEKVLREFCNETLHLRKNRHRTNNRYGMHVLYSPIVRLEQKRVCAFDTKLIINDPYYGIVDSKLFLPIAERNKQIKTVDKIYIEKVFRSIMRARYRGIFLTDVFIHLSMELLSLKSILMYLKTLMKQFRIESQQVVISVEEGDIHQSSTKLKPIIEGIHALGMRFAVSSFGEEAGIVSLLSSLPLDYVVFSKKVTEKMFTDQRVRDVISGLAKIPSGLGIKLVYEGISTSDQAIKVHDLGGKYVSGPLYGKDMYLDELYQRLGRPDS